MLLLRKLLRIEEMNAAVEPLPFVPAICIALRPLRSDGYDMAVSVPSSYIERHLALNLSYLISDSVQPFNHFRDRLFVHLSPGFPDRVDNGEV